MTHHGLPCHFISCIHSLIHSFIHSLAHSFTHSLIHSFDAAMHAPSILHFNTALAPGFVVPCFARPREEFRLNKMDSIVSIKHCNAYVDGFGSALDGKADAVFLDLPQPWLALPHATRSLKAGGQLCAFSPCVEQVHKTIAVLNELGYEGVAQGVWAWTMSCTQAWLWRRRGCSVSQRNSCRALTCVLPCVHGRVRHIRRGINHRVFNQGSGGGRDGVSVGATIHR